jgi:hypothetical protein
MFENKLFPEAGGGGKGGGGGGEGGRKRGTDARWGACACAFSGSVWMQYPPVVCRAHVASGLVLWWNTDRQRSQRRPAFGPV